MFVFGICSELNKMIKQEMETTQQKVGASKTIFETENAVKVKLIKVEETLTKRKLKYFGTFPITK